MSEDRAHLETLELKLKDLQCKNERLRDARAKLTSQLGPLPISAAIVAGLVSAFAPGDTVTLDAGLAYAALGVFLLMVIFSAVFSGFAPYRRLREVVERNEAERKPDPRPRPLETTDPVEWTERMIEIESAVRGEAALNSGTARINFEPLTLQDAYDQEWKALFVTKLLFAVGVGLLIAARFAG